MHMQGNSFKLNKLLTYYIYSKRVYFQKIIGEQINYNRIWIPYQYYIWGT